MNVKEKSGRYKGEKTVYIVHRNHAVKTTRSHLYVFEQRDGHVKLIKQKVRHRCDSRIEEAAKLLIREKGINLVLDGGGEKVASLVVHE